MKLSQADKQSLKDSGITHVVVVEEIIQQGYINRVLRGRNVASETMYGVWEEGESASDIRWQYEKIYTTQRGMK